LSEEYFFFFIIFVEVFLFIIPFKEGLELSYRYFI